jgi:hypothetical protein
MTYKRINDTAKEVRKQLKQKYPACKFSVTIEKYSGGQSMTVALMAAPFAVFENGSNPDGYAQLNQYTLRNEYATDRNCNGAQLTEQAWNVMKDTDKIASADNWDNSDSQIDYFDVNYYLHLAIGKWDRPVITA